MLDDLIRRLFRRKPDPRAIEAPYKVPDPHSDVLDIDYGRPRTFASAPAALHNLPRDGAPPSTIPAWFGATGPLPGDEFPEPHMER